MHQFGGRLKHRQGAAIEELGFCGAALSRQQCRQHCHVSGDLHLVGSHRPLTNLERAAGIGFAGNKSIPRDFELRQTPIQAGELEVVGSKSLLGNFESVDLSLVSFRHTTGATMNAAQLV